MISSSIVPHEASPIDEFVLAADMNHPKLTEQEQFQLTPGITFVSSQLTLNFLIDALLLLRLFR